jgi:hypothetical protein
MPPTEHDWQHARNQVCTLQSTTAMDYYRTQGTKAHHCAPKFTVAVKAGKSARSFPLKIK